MQKPSPARLSLYSRDTINSANDWHFAMMNDKQRNAAFAAGLAQVVTPSSTVIDVGAGSGLLSLISAKAGARRVYAIEANADLANIAEGIIADNAFADTISLIRRMSTSVTTEDIEGSADVLVSEVLGTLLLGESALEYMADARERLLRKGGAIVPSHATQYATAITSDGLDLIARAHDDMGLALGRFNRLQDTSGVFFSKQLGVRLSDLGFAEVSPPIALFIIDFAADSQADLPRGARAFRFAALRDATVHALMFTWEAWTDAGRSFAVSTHPNATRDNLPRDMAWGQALQLVEDTAALHGDPGAKGPAPFTVRAGEQIELVMYNLNTYSHFSGELRRVPPPADAGGGTG